MAQPPLQQSASTAAAPASSSSITGPSPPSPSCAPSHRSAPPAPLSAFLPWSPAAPSGFPTPSFEQQQQQPAYPPSSRLSPSPTSAQFAPLSPVRSSLNVSQYSNGSVSSSHSFRTLHEMPSPPPSSGLGSGFGPGGAAGAAAAKPGGSGPAHHVVSPSTSFTTLPPPVTQLSLPLLEPRSDSTLSNASSTRTSSFFSQRFTLAPPAPPAPLEVGKALSRAGSVGKSGLDSATISRLGVGMPGRRGDHPRSASDASVGPRPSVPPMSAHNGVGGGTGAMRETWANKPYFAFERDVPASRAVSNPTGPSRPAALSLMGLPRSSSPPPQDHAGLPHSRLADAPALPEPTAGEILEEEESLQLDADGREVDGRRKRKRRRWRLEGSVLGRGAFSCVWGARELVDGPSDEAAAGGIVVAVKMMSKEACRENDRTFTSFAREVSILKKLSHPAVIPHLTSFTTPTHHCVVLPLVRGGELFSVIEDPARWERVSRGWVKRVWKEIEAGVAYLHTAGVVHRDIKLENILLTQPFPPASAGPLSKSDLPPIPTAVIQLTDFGLAKEVAPADPPLTTRCGSDSYAAPEIIMGRAYDGRKTDSWACGVVLFALLTRALPFGSPPVDDPSLESKASRRARMLRIAKGDYVWPAPPPPSSSSAGATLSASPPVPVALQLDATRLAIGSPRLVNAGARRLVDRLLTREPQKRGVVGALGAEDGWGDLEEAGDWPLGSS